MLVATTVSVHPVEILRKYVTDLEAAILLCLDNPTKKPVHRLRTMTRRIEAQLALLDLLHTPKIHTKDARQARRLLKKIRRAAGEVRDLDVQRDLITSHSSVKTRKDSRKLSASLKQQRSDAATELQETLGKYQATLAETLEALLKTLDDGDPLSVSVSDLAKISSDWFAHNAPAPSEDPDSLHTIRKKAKIARYLAENSPREALLTQKIAEAFEAVQQSGGEWHDWLILAAIAHDELGESSPLATNFTRLCERSLASYRRHLSKDLPKALAHPQV
jgi:CHAD domain-containing protein